MKKTFLSQGLIVLVLVGLGACGSPTNVCEADTVSQAATIEQITTFFDDQDKTVLTFVGYSGAGYEDDATMRATAESVLAEFSPDETVVNIGATPDGIGAVYELAAQKGFTTTGIVSTQAQAYDTPTAPCVDYVFYVNDSSWGGFIEGTDQLSPTSAAMVENSDILVGIGGGEVARDELIAAQAAGREVRFFPADMNHQTALEKAEKKGLPAPTDFSGAADEAF